MTDGDLGDGEELESWLANHTVSRFRAVGGRLRVVRSPAGGRVMFRPSGIEATLGGQVWSVRFADITRVGACPVTFNLFNGGMRRRLELETRDGGVHHFVVNGLDAVMARLHALISADR